MPNDSIFADDWRDCLKSHYQTVIREQDGRTERTLRGVMFNVGFDEDELNELRVLATMRADDVGEDFVPDLQIFEAVVSPAVKAAETANVVETEAEGATHGSPLQDAIPIFEAEAEVTSEIELVDEVDAESDAEAEEEAPPYDESGPQQLSMF